MGRDIPPSMRAELGRWNDGAGVALEDWSAMTGDFRAACGYAAQFWPELEAVGPYILHKDDEMDVAARLEIAARWEKPPGTPSGAVEAMLNHRHISDFQARGPEFGATPDRLLFIGRIYAEMLEAKLRLRFPDRPCVVEFYRPEDPEDLDGYEVTFRQRKWDDEAG